MKLLDTVKKISNRQYKSLIDIIMHILCDVHKLNKCTGYRVYPSACLDWRIAYKKIFGHMDYDGGGHLVIQLSRVQNLCIPIRIEPFRSYVLKLKLKIKKSYKRRRILLRTLIVQFKGYVTFCLKY